MMNASAITIRRQLGPRIGLGVLALLGSLLALPADDGPTEWQGKGRCQFHLAGYTLSPETEAQINKVVADALAQHEQVFGFKADPDFRVRIRIFGNYADYEQYTLAHRAGRRIARHFPSLTNLSGYYSHATREIVTWRQQQPSYLANNLLHEASHAIMFAHYRRMPTWLSEGCATYFAFPPQMQDAEDIGSLRYRWAKLTLWLRRKELPELKTFLDLDDEAWHKLGLEKAYTTSWSLFQLLMSTPERKQILQRLMAELQELRGPQTPCVARLAALYPGGLERLEQDWRHWILRVGTRVLGPKREELLQRIP